MEHSLLEPAYLLLEAFAHEPRGEKYAKEIELSCGTSHERTLAYLKRLEQGGIVAATRRGRQVFYKLNPQNEVVLLALQALEIMKRNKLLAHNKELAVLLHDTKQACFNAAGKKLLLLALFGSAARNERRPQSDIDVFIVTADRRSANAAANAVSAQSSLYEKKISPHAVTLPEMRKKWHSEPAYATLFRDRIILHGNEFFWNFVFEEGEP